MSNTIIRVENLSKRYTLSHQQEGRQYKSLRDVIGDRVKSLVRAAQSPKSKVHDTSREDFWALKDVNFEIKQGDRVGIIGRNGAGKSTLLKVLSRIIEPTTGQIGIKGRVASLLEVGTGFHPELTGRENIYLNGAILGMSRAEIARKFDEIVAFAEVERFLDTPVKRYSSGMYVRLAFAVAAHLEPEILIVDEVLAVGDAQFQKKCLGKMEDVGKEGRTILFVSHDIGAVNNLTNQCLYLKQGSVLANGNTFSVVSEYLNSASHQNVLPTDVGLYRRENKDSKIPTVQIERIWMETDKSKSYSVGMGESFKIFVEFDSKIQLNGANLTVIIRDCRNEKIAIIFSWDSGFYISCSPGKQCVSIMVNDISLTPGKYSVDAGINQSAASTVAFDVIQSFPLFEVINDGQVEHWLERPWGSIHPHGVQWSITSKSVLVESY
jgi:lipopolysaccharide transport system ATP-binding protein